MHLSFTAEQLEFHGNSSLHWCNWIVISIAILKSLIVRCCTARRWAVSLVVGLSNFPPSKNTCLLLVRGNSSPARRSRPPITSLCPCRSAQVLRSRASLVIANWPENPYFEKYCWLGFHYQGKYKVNPSPISTLSVINIILLLRDPTFSTRYRGLALVYNIVVLSPPLIFQNACRYHSSSFHQGACCSKNEHDGYSKC